MIITKQKIVRLTVAAFSFLVLTEASAAPTSCNFSNSNAIDCQMKNGARWEFNWTNDQKRGLVLNQISLTAKLGAPKTLIIEQAALAQVLQSDDNNSGSQHVVSDDGLPLMPLSSEDCPLPGRFLQNNGAGSPLLCQMTIPRGYAWRSLDQLQGENIGFFGVSKAGKNTYIHQWLFGDDGTLHVMLGVTGEIDPQRDSTSAQSAWPISLPTRFATNRFHTAYWRIDFALAGQTNDLFQQLDYKTGSDGYTVNQFITDMTSEGKFTIQPEAQRFWVLRDKVVSHSSNRQKIGFQIVPNHSSVHRGSDPITGFDIYVTQNRACEKFASHNPTTNGCGSTLNDYVNNETLNDPVVWIGTTWHQVPRAEDESNVQTHWQSFTLSPRDLTEASPF